MKLYRYPEKELWQQLIQRPFANNDNIKKKVRKIVKEVKDKGDKALRKFSKEFDGAAIKNIEVTENEITRAEALLGYDLKKAIQQAKCNIETFHLSQTEETKMIETMPGVVCWRRSKAIEKVGLYIPGGSAPLFSTVLMLAVPATVAGCSEIVLCTPPDKNGCINPAVLYTAQLCGITKIFKIGGAQAIAAMAFGTETVPKVHKIFGPGNRYVTMAKQLLQQDGVAIDMPAGPSELLVIADDTAVPSFVAADLLSQAEHGPDSQVILITTSKTVAEKVNQAVVEQLNALPRKEIAAIALKNSKTILLKSLCEAAEFSNLYAPEHLILACSELIVEKITTAGSVFIGNYSPESAGDYASGTNHTLPTYGFAAMHSGVSLDSFVKKITYQKLTREGLEHIGKTVMTMADAEGLCAHKKAVEIRLQALNSYQSLNTA